MTSTQEHEFIKAAARYFAAWEALERAALDQDTLPELQKEKNEAGADYRRLRDSVIKAMHGAA